MNLNWQELIFIEELVKDNAKYFHDAKYKMIIESILEKIEETQIKVDEQHEAEAEDIRINEIE